MFEILLNGYFVAKNRNLSIQILCTMKNFSKLINVKDGIRVCRMENFKKLIRFAARLLERLKYLHKDGQTDLKSEIVI